ncbi:hypothetical protein U724_14975 [Pseudomonas chlororaphis subsp. aurantiaca PB-St2]|nr:hypothetical protein U724_14975 [Pseudomonas chlororaphis subsp. aurantiaca PB-St2]
MAASWTADGPCQRRWPAAAEDVLADGISDRENGVWCDFRYTLIQVARWEFWIREGPVFAGCGPLLASDQITQLPAGAATRMLASGHCQGIAHAA